MGFISSNQAFGGKQCRTLLILRMKFAAQLSGLEYLACRHTLTFVCASSESFSRSVGSSCQQPKVLSQQRRRLGDGGISRSWSFRGKGIGVKMLPPRQFRLALGSKGARVWWWMIAGVWSLCWKQEDTILPTCIPISGSGLILTPPQPLTLFKQLSFYTLN